MTAGIVAAPVAELAGAAWPESAEDTELPAIAGFVSSAFSPMVAHVADRCLERAGKVSPATGIVLASVRGDTATARVIAEAVAAGRRVPPLMFFQSNPNAVIGHVAAKWGLTGPVVCTSPAGDAASDALACAAVLLSGEAEQVLVIVADLGEAGEPDRAHALLVTSKGRP